MSGVRLVQTGWAPDGRSTITSDRVVPEVVLPTGRRLVRAWESDSVLFTPTRDDEDPPAPYPGAGGGRLWTLTVPTETAGPPARLHSTPTTDLGVVLSGRVVLELEDGSRAQLAAGDAFVQAGTAHRWRNPHPADAVLAVVVLGREPSSSF